MDRSLIGFTRRASGGNRPGDDGDDGLAILDPYLIDPESLVFDWADDPLPLAFVDLDSWKSARPSLRLPPFPVIGRGDPAHPAARLLDAVIEGPVPGRILVEQVTRYPNAAAAAVQLLRSIEGLPVERALTLESLCYGMLQGSGEHREWLEAGPFASSRPPGRIVTTRDGPVLRVVIDRPQFNAIDRGLRDGLYEAFSIAALDPDIKRVELRSAARVFSIGADLAEFGTTRDRATAHRIRSLTLPAHPLSQRAEIVDVYIQGACIGAGLEMAAFAGRITASPHAWFQLPELAMGLIPGAGGCFSVSRRIGRQRAALMILSGRRINAAIALRWGLIDAIEDQSPIDPGGADGD
jgi:enoyl-CoA hydratase